MLAREGVMWHYVREVSGHVDFPDMLCNVY